MVRGPASSMCGALALLQHVEAKRTGRSGIVAGQHVMQGYPDYYITVPEPPLEPLDLMGV